jgi:hypothetical protein
MSKSDNGLFLITVNIGRGSSTDMPPRLIGACVPVFAAGANHEVAARAAVLKLVAVGFRREDVSRVQASTSRSERRSGRRVRGQRVLGPFAGYEKESG